MVLRLPQMQTRLLQEVASTYVQLHLAEGGVRLQVQPLQ